MNTIPMGTIIKYTCVALFTYDILKAIKVYFKFYEDLQTILDQTWTPTFDPLLESIKNQPIVKQHFGENIEYDSGKTISVKCLDSVLNIKGLLWAKPFIFQNHLTKKQKTLTRPKAVIQELKVTNQFPLVVPNNDQELPVFFYSEARKLLSAPIKGSKNSGTIEVDLYSNFGSWKIKNVNLKVNDTTIQLVKPDIPSKVKEYKMIDTFSSLLPISMIMIGCCSNVVSLELIIKQSSSQGNLITFSQFLFVALMSFFTNIRWKKIDRLLWIPVGMKPRKIPLSYYLLMVAIFFVVSTLNNLALKFDISLPFHMIFRSSSLLSTVVIGALFWRKSYTMKQIASLLMVTIGITVATLNSMPNKPETKVIIDPPNVFNFLIGITMLTIAMFMSSVLGLVQEHSYKLYGKECHTETIFYTHLFSLPFFILLKDDLIEHIQINNQSPLIMIPYIESQIPTLWFYLLVNVITQYICIQGVFILTGKTSTLTCTLVISIRKFISIIISVIYFNNPFTPKLWLCTALVFLGSFIYSDPFKKKPSTQKKTQ
ncbi:hypothetical protein DLAC_02539 [Tieghemostelium lacteum]|uniref:Uncharacterized protein n=1 Tax=Tieghemostelium lacteum TaxID=361077 RepID=A0A152A2R1_TIELA|nr:hypothetical protein DLAC_02539 [Tieghemostelium lacteum]|eukprot:KYR00528.1 hypothetical protein DLAC_02539 [Tieghemostelium lacteum]